MSSWFEKATGLAGAVGIGGILTYLGTRYTAKKNSEPGLAMANVENRRTNLDEIQLILERHDRQIASLTEDLLNAREDVRKGRILLRLALQHIGLLRKEMRAANIEPPVLPEKLTNDMLPWDIDMYEN